MLNYPEAVTAASLALPIVEREIEALQRSLPTDEWSNAGLGSLQVRRNQLLTIITDMEW